MKKIVGVLSLVALLSFQANAQEHIAQFNEEGLLYSNTYLIVGNIYPNPASNVALIRYSIIEKDKTAKIIVHNLLGTMTRDYFLNPNEENLKIDTQDFKEGVYFYTLSTEGESKVTKKLIVKK